MTVHYPLDPIVVRLVLHVTAVLVFFLAIVVLVACIGSKRLQIVVPVDGIEKSDKPLYLIPPEPGARRAVKVSERVHDTLAALLDLLAAVLMTAPPPCG